MQDVVLLIVTLFSMVTYVWADYHSGLREGRSYDPRLLIKIASWVLLGVVIADALLFMLLTRRSLVRMLFTWRLWLCVAVALPIVLLAVLPEDTPLAVQRVLVAAQSLRVLLLFRALRFIHDRERLLHLHAYFFCLMY